MRLKYWIDPFAYRGILIIAISFVVRIVMEYLRFVMFRIKCQTIFEASAVKLKIYDPIDEAAHKGELHFVSGAQRSIF